MHRVVLAEPPFAQLRDVQRCVRDAVFRCDALENLLRTVAAAIVDRENFKSRIVLRQHRSHASLDIVFFVLGGDQHRDLRSRCGKLDGTGRRERLLKALVPREGQMPGRPHQSDQYQQTRPNCKCDVHGESVYPRVVHQSTKATRDYRPSPRGLQGNPPAEHGDRHSTDPCRRLSLQCAHGDYSLTPPPEKHIA